MQSYKNKKITQSDLEKIILPELKKAKEKDKEKNINLYDFLTTLGFKPEFIDLNFSIKDLTIRSSTPGPAGVSIIHGTELLTHLDYSRCEFKQCHFDDCNLSHSQFNLMGFAECSLNKTVMQNCFFEEITFDDCIMDRISFDASRLCYVEFQNSKLNDAVFTHLEECLRVNIINCELNGIHFLGSSKSIDSEIYFSKKTILENAYLFQSDFKIVNATIKKNKPAIGISWRGEEKGYTAELARTALIHKGMQPIHTEYCPFLSRGDLVKLENEVKSILSLVLKKKTIVEPKKLKSGLQKSIPFEIIETALKAPKSYPIIINLYHYAKSALTELDGFLVPGGADVNPLLYGQDAHVKTRPMKSSDYTDLRRDIIEFSFFHQQQILGIPIYAICRGSQICALFYGAEFYQHIGDARGFIGDRITLVKPEIAKSRLSHIHSLEESIHDCKDDHEQVLFIHHQGFCFNKKTERALFEVVAKTTIQNLDAELDLTVAAESLPRNIFMVQFHPECGRDEKIRGSLKVSSKLSSSFLNEFSTAVYDYIKEHHQGTDLRIYAKHHKYFIHRNHIQHITSPYHPKSKSAKYDTVIIGMGHSGLLAGLAAIKRGERVAFLTDCSMPGSYIQEQVVTIDYELVQFLKELINPKILDRYIREKKIIEYFDKAKPRFTLSIGTYLKILTEELASISGDKFDTYEVSMIDKNLLDRLNKSKARLSPVSMGPMLQVDKEVLHDLTELRYMQDVDLSSQSLTLANIKSINKTPITSAEETRQLEFQNLMICNGGNRSIENGLLEVNGDIPFSIYPVAPFHAAVIFELKSYSPLEYSSREQKTKEVRALLKPVPLDVLKKCQWEYISRPYCQIYTIKDEKSDEGCLLCVCCEIPDDLFRSFQSSSIKDKIEASKKIRNFARLLLKDKLPESTIKDVIDPESTISDSSSQAYPCLSVSPFKLEFFELDHTCIVRKHPERTPAVINFLGNAQMLALYTTETSLQSSARLVLHCHKVHLKLNEGLKSIASKSYSSLKERQNAIEALYVELFSRYHAIARHEIDKMRDAQYNWIETRNNREMKARQFYEMHNTIVDITKKIDSIILMLSPQNNKSFHHIRLFSQPKLSLLHHHLHSLKNRLILYFVDPSTVIDYESLLDKICIKRNHGTSKNFYTNLIEICIHIQELNPQLSEFMVSEAATLNISISKLISFCRQEINHIAKQDEAALRHLAITHSFGV